MSINTEQPLPTTAQHSSPISITLAATAPSVTSMSTISELNSDSPQSLQPSSDYNASPPDPELEADEQILEALRSPKDRLFVLRLGESMESLVQDRHNRIKIELVPTSSYHKLLVHRCAAYYRLTPVTEAGSKVVTLVVVHESRIPLRRIADLVPADDSPCRPFQIMRRSLHAPRSKASSQTGSGNDESAAGAGDISDGEPSEAGSVRGARKKTLTLSERQAQYEEARSRIFKDLEEKEKQKSQDMSASSSTLSLLSVDSSSVGAASGGGSSSVGESPDDSGSVDRDREWDSSPKDKREFSGHTVSVTPGTARSSRHDNNSLFNGGHPASYYPTLYDPSGPSGPSSAQPQSNHPHYQSPVYAVYSYGPPSMLPPYPYPFAYPPPPPSSNDSSAGHINMNPAPPISPNESSTASTSDVYAMPPVSYIGPGPYMWSQPPHAPPNPHAPQVTQSPPEYGQMPFHHPPPHPQAMHPYAYGGPMHPYPPPLQHPHSPQSPHPPHVQSRMHVPQLQPPSQPQVHPPAHTYQPQPQHPPPLFHQLPHPSQMSAPSSQPQMSSLSLRPQSLGASPEGYAPGSNPAIAPSHTHTHTNGTNSQPPPTGYEHYTQAPPPPPPMWIPPHNGSFTYPQPSHNTLPPRRPAGKALYDPAAEKESNQQSHLGPRFPYRRNGGRPGMLPHLNTGQNASFSGETAHRKKMVPGFNNNNPHTNFQPSSTSGSSSSISTSSTASQSSTSSSKPGSGSTSTSKHPLPARPDWAVGLKPQPNHRHQQHSGIPSQRNHPNRLPSDHQADFPALQSTDFPPLSLNANNNAISGNIGSNVLHRQAPGGAWAAPPATRAFLGPGSNASMVADGILKGSTSMDTNGSTMLGVPQPSPMVNDWGNVPSRLDEPDRAFERPGPKAGGELFNPNATIAKGTANKNTKGKASPHSLSKSKTTGAGNVLMADTGTGDEMAASAAFVDRVASLRISNGKDDGGNDSHIVPVS